MTGPTLYELGDALSSAFAEIDAELEQTDGEFTEAMQQRLSEAELAFSDKVERVALYCRSLAVEAAVVKVEEERLAKRRKAMERKADWLKDVYLKHALESQSKEEVRGSLATVRLTLNPPAASSYIPLEFLDPRWVRTKTELSLDKAAVLAAHKAGEPLPPELKVERAVAVRIS